MLDYHGIKTSTHKSYNYSVLAKNALEHIAYTRKRMQVFSFIKDKIKIYSAEVRIPNE